MLEPQDNRVNWSSLNLGQTLFKNIEKVLRRIGTMATASKVARRSSIGIASIIVARDQIDIVGDDGVRQTEAPCDLVVDFLRSLASESCRLA